MKSPSWSRLAYSTIASAFEQGVGGAIICWWTVAILHTAAFVIALYVSSARRGAREGNGGPGRER